MKFTPALIALVTLTAACGRVADTGEQPDYSGCFSIATGKVLSWWRPNFSLPEAPATPLANFYLAKGTAPIRNLQDWGAMFNQGTTQKVWVMNWRVNRDHSVTLTHFNVDWGYTMELEFVGADSVVGVVTFAGDHGTNGSARVRGRRAACSALGMPAEDSTATHR
jgi:hypothetical protein